MINHSQHSRHFREQRQRGWVVRHRARRTFTRQKSRSLKQGSAANDTGYGRTHTEEVCTEVGWPLMAYSKKELPCYCGTENYTECIV